MEFKPDDLIEQIKGAEAVLVGIGKEFSVKEDNCHQVLAAYDRLSQILQKKNYFIISENDDRELYGHGFNEKRVINMAVEDLHSKEGEKQWNLYNAWLMASLKKKLLIIELGVGFQAPNMIRWPFERVTYIGNNTRLVRIHNTFWQVDEKIKEKSQSIPSNSLEFMNSQMLYRS